MEPPGRDLVQVINDCLDIIPETESDLRAALASHASSYRYAAPEMRQFWWEETANTLTQKIGQPSKLWEKQVAATFNNEVFLA